jgi:glycosyltransferase involved in cell wall biosynthesis
MRKFNRCLINASNLHVGGGVQVASSFLTEIFSLNNNFDGVSVLASEKVDRNLSIGQDEKKIFSSYKIQDVYGIKSMLTLGQKLNSFKCVFTIFGPLYAFRKPYFSIVGFAQPWIIYPQNECYEMMGVFDKIFCKLKYLIQAFYFKRADVIIVELDHVKSGLINVLGIEPSKIHIIRNCISAIYYKPKTWRQINSSDLKNVLRLGFPGRNYLHKNTTIFPGIAKELKSRFGIDALFYVTFTDEEWKSSTADFKNCCVNIGELTVNQCPNFYKMLDGVVFPSLLECFSATPLEAMFMEKPLFVADKSFNHDICQGHAYYFNPLSPASAAEKISMAFGTDGVTKEKLIAAREHAINFSNPKDRAEKYLDLMEYYSSRLDFYRDT